MDLESSVLTRVPKPLVLTTRPTDFLPFSDLVPLQLRVERPPPAVLDEQVALELGGVGALVRVDSDALEKRRKKDAESSGERNMTICKHFRAFKSGKDAEEPFLL